MQRYAVACFTMIAFIAAVVLGGTYAHAVEPNIDHLLPEHFTVYVLGDTVVNWPAPGSRRTTLATCNLYRGPRGGYVACYSHRAVGSAYGVGGSIYVMGQVRLRGDYDGRIFQPDGYRGADISAAPHFKQVCAQALGACRAGNCWAGGDTGGWFGIQ
jgi:hypothetical protein